MPDVRHRAFTYLSPLMGFVILPKNIRRIQMKEYKSVIEDLFNGNVMIEEMLELQGEDAEHLRSVQVEIDKKLRDNLTKEQYQIHEEYMTSAHDISNREVYKAYMQGIYLGLRLMSEAFYHTEL